MQKTEGGGLRAEGGGRMTEDGGQRSEGAGLRTKGGGRRTIRRLRRLHGLGRDRSQRSDVRCQMSEVGGRKGIEDGGLRTEGGKE